MNRPDRASLAISAPFDDLLTLLLRQFKRPLATFGVELTELDIRALAAAVVAGQSPDAQAVRVRDGLITLVAESEAVLGEWRLSFQQSMQTEMDAMPGWESTSDFLEIANVKSNAEIRIAAGAALVAALDDLRYAPYLLFLAERDDDDIDTAVARRVLAFKTGVALDTPDWLNRVKAKLQL